VTPSWDELSADAHVVAIPLRVPFRGHDGPRGAAAARPAGWGEFAPFPEYDDEEAAAGSPAAVEAAWTGWPAPVRDRVPVNATVPAVAADDVPGVLARFPGCTTAKVKVAQTGQALSDDVARVAAVRSALGRTGRVRVDANGAWSVDEARTALAALAPYDLEYAEQPCADVAGLAALRLALARAGVDVPVAADESVRKAEDPLRVALAGAADVVVLKVAPLRGVAPALDVAEACGLPVVVSSALDTSVGIAAGLALAAALPELPYACGLATAGLLAGDVVADPLTAVGGHLPVGAVAADPEMLERWTAPPDRTRWWLARARRCLALPAG
jgi:O-succinylbenzoate synthase